MKETGRRKFIKSIGTAGAAAATAPLWTSCEDKSTEKKAVNKEIAANVKLEDPTIGVQISPHSILDEGVDHCLDLLKEKGQVNTLFMNVNSYYGGMGKDLNVLGDHGVPKIDNSTRELPLMWLNHDDSFFKNTTLRYPKRDTSKAYGTTDIFAEIAQGVKDRGMKLYLRFYEGWGKARATTIPGWEEKIWSKDMYGNPHELPCWNKPDLTEFWKATFADVATNYNIDGIQFGAERSGSFRQVLYGLAPATCFCNYCEDRAAKKNIDLGRVKEGNIKIYEFIMAMKANKMVPAEGVLAKLLRLIFEYPEVLMWDKEDRLSRDEVYQACYDQVKAVDENIQFGIHITDTQARCPIEHAQTHYNNMQSYSDFIKIIAYHDIGGVRMARNMRRLQQGMLRDLEVETILDMVLQTLGFDDSGNIDLNQIDTQGLPSVEYVSNIVRRSVGQIDDDTKIYAGIGFDIPKGKDWNGDKFPSEPKEIEAAVLAAFNAGAKGIVASREYEEMEQKSIEAFGNAVKKVIA